MRWSVVSVLMLVSLGGCEGDIVGTPGAEGGTYPQSGGGGASGGEGHLTNAGTAGELRSTAVGGAPRGGSAGTPAVGLGGTSSGEGGSPISAGGTPGEAGDGSGGGSGGDGSGGEGSGGEGSGGEGSGGDGSGGDGSGGDGSGGEGSGGDGSGGDGSGGEGGSHHSCEGPGFVAATVQECVEAAPSGATLYVVSPVDENVTVSDKELTIVGDRDGALTSWTSADATIRALTIGTNSEVTVSGFVFENCGTDTTHIADGGSGAIILRADASGTIRGNVFRNNIGWRGAAIVRMEPAPGTTVRVEDNIFHHNHADDGGAIHFMNDQTVILINNLVYENSAADYSGGVWLRNLTGTQVTIQRNTIWNNEALRAYGLDAYDFTSGVANSCIIDDLDPEISSQYTSTTDPGFVNPSAGDFTLEAGSSAINAGDPSLPDDSDGTPPDRGCDFGKLPTEPP